MMDQSLFSDTPSVVHDTNLCGAGAGERQEVNLFVDGLVDGTWLTDGNINTCVSFPRPETFRNTITYSMATPRKTFKLVSMTNATSCSSKDYGVSVSDNGVFYPCKSYERRTEHPYCRSVCNCPSLCNTIHMDIIGGSVNLCELIIT